MIDGALFGIKAAVLVIVVEALIRIGRRSLNTKPSSASRPRRVHRHFLSRPALSAHRARRRAGRLLRQPRAVAAGRRRSAPLAPVHLALLVGLTLWWAPVVLSALLLGSDMSSSTSGFFQARRGELRRRLCAARVHGAAGGGELRLMSAPEMVDGSGSPRRSRARSSRSRSS